MASSTVRVLLYVMFGYLNAANTLYATRGIELELPRSGSIDLKFEEMGSTIEPVFKHSRDPYWQYYADCDRWGVEFSVSDNHEANPRSVARMAFDSQFSIPLAAEDRDKSTEWQPRISERAKQPSKKYLSISGVFFNKAALIVAKFRIPLDRRSIDSFRPWTDSIEFHAVESRHVDFDLITVGPGHPIGMSIHWAVANQFRRVSNNVQKNQDFSIIDFGFRRWNSTWTGIIESEIARESFKFLSETEAKRISHEFAIRMEMADQIDTLGTFLQRYADSIRFVAVPAAIESNRESIAKRPNLQVDDRTR